MKKLLESGEMYLETIKILNEKTDVIRAIDIADYMGYSKPSVSRALKILKNDGYIYINENGHIELSKLGQNIADSIYEKHLFLSQLLMEIGVDKDIAIKDACRMEHIISEETFEKLKEHSKRKNA